MVLAATMAWAGTDDEVPTINPTATYTSVDGEETESNEMSGQAPLVGRFKANPSNVGDYNATYEWRFTKEGETQPYLTRYEEETVPRHLCIELTHTQYKWCEKLGQ